MKHHTPGPWVFEEGDRGDDSVGMPPTPPIICADPEGDGNVVPVCTLDEPLRYVDREPRDEYDECVDSVGDYRANARLIAAAPMLLDALRELLRDTQHAEHDCGDERYCPVLYARRAIAAATGEETPA